MRFSNVTAIGGGYTDENGNDAVLPTIYQPEYSVSGLSGAVFEIYADENITTPDGTVRYTKDTLVDTITTGKKGTATSKQLYLGRYRVVETAVRMEQLSIPNLIRLNLPTQDRMKR